MTETYSLLSASIKANSDNRDSLVSLGKRITRHYNNGTISARELSQLDGMIMLRLAKLDSANS